MTVKLSLFFWEAQLNVSLSQQRSVDETHNNSNSSSSADTDGEKPRVDSVQVSREHGWQTDRCFCQPRSPQPNINISVSIGGGSAEPHGIDLYFPEKHGLRLTMRPDNSVSRSDWLRSHLPLRCLWRKSSENPDLKLTLARCLDLPPPSLPPLGFTQVCACCKKNRNRK